MYDTHQRVEIKCQVENKSNWLFDIHTTELTLPVLVMKDIFAGCLGLRCGSTFVIFVHFRTEVPIHVGIP